LTNDMVLAALHQKTLLLMLPENQAFQKFVKSRQKKERDDVTKLMRECNFERWERFKTVIVLTKHFSVAHLICSREKTHLSCFPLVVKALQNSIVWVVEGDTFDLNLGAGAGKEVMEVLGVRFNLDGSPVPGRKVGFLDEFHIWCFMVDPYSDEWRNSFKFANEGGLRALATNMIAHFVPADEEDAEKTRRDLRDEFEVSSKIVVCYLDIFIVLYSSGSDLCFISHRSSGHTLVVGQTIGIIQSQHQ